MDIMDPQWPSRKAERLSGSGRGRLNSYSPSRQTRVSPCAPVLCPLGASSRVRRHSQTRRHGVRPQKAHPPTLLLQPSIVCVLPRTRTSDLGAIWERVVVFSNAYRFSKILHDVIGTSGGHMVFGFSSLSPPRECSPGPP